LEEAKKNKDQVRAEMFKLRNENREYQRVRAKRKH